VDYSGCWDHSDLVDWDSDWAAADFADLAGWEDLVASVDYPAGLSCPDSGCLDFD
jgi:hypothetical protein